MNEKFEETRVNNVEIKSDLHVSLQPKKVDELKPVEQKFEKPKLEISLGERLNFYADKMATVAKGAVEIAKAYNSASNVVNAVVIIIVILMLILIGTKIF